MSFGHNPLAAKYHIAAGQQASLLTINLSQDGVNHTLIKIYGREHLDTISQLAFEELIVEYIKNNFTLYIDDGEIKLAKGGIKLGSHQTDLKFVLPPIIPNVEKVVISIPAFKENENHQTIFSYDLNGTDHKILSSLNNFQSTIMLSQPRRSLSWIWILILGVLSFSTIIYLR